MHLAKRSATQDFQGLQSDINDYVNAARRHLGRPLEGLRMFEVGFGARPVSLCWIHSLGLDVRGIDLDAPVISFDWGQLLSVLKKNGIERAAKSLAREILVGDTEWKDAAAAFAKANPGKTFVIPKHLMIIGDAAEPEIWETIGKLDFVYSENVFEHIPRDRIPLILRQMALALAPDGLAYIRPHMFTGIAGGHDVDWYPGRLQTDRKRPSEPWEHLRRNRFVANTYLNKARIADYLELFSIDFDILEYVKDDGEWGRPFLTDELKAELSDYSEEELMTDRMSFILKPKPVRQMQSRDRNDR
ncbi:MAG: class I SAM-dependent methyltransferase [Pseudomonadota bacterium]